MASPSGGSLSTLITRGTRSGMSSEHPRPGPRPEIETHPVGTVSGRHRPNPGRRRGCSPSSGIPQRKSVAASVTSTDTPAAAAQVQHISASTTARTVRPSSPWGISPASASRPTSVTFYVDFPDGRRQSPFLVAAWAYSNAPS